MKGSHRQNPWFAWPTDGPRFMCELWWSWRILCALHLGFSWNISFWENAVAIVLTKVGNKWNVERHQVSHCFFRIDLFPPVLFQQVPSFLLRNFARRTPCTRTLRNRGFASEDAEKAKDSFDSIIQGSWVCKMRTESLLSSPIHCSERLVFFDVFFVLGNSRYFSFGFLDPDAWWVCVSTAQDGAPKLVMQETKVSNSGTADSLLQVLDGSMSSSERSGPLGRLAGKVF